MRQTFAALRFISAILIAGAIRWAEVPPPKVQPAWLPPMNVRAVPSKW